MSIKTPAELVEHNFCPEHRIYYNRHCPDCIVQETPEKTAQPVKHELVDVE